MLFVQLRTCDAGSRAASQELLQRAAQAATRVPVISAQPSVTEALSNVDRPQAGGPPAAGFNRKQ